MSKDNRAVVLPAWEPKGAGLLVQEITAPDGTGTYLMVGIQTAEGRLGVVLPYRSLEALAAALTRSQNAQALLEGTEAGKRT